MLEIRGNFEEAPKKSFKSDLPWLTLQNLQLSSLRFCKPTWSDNSIYTVYIIELAICTIMLQLYSDDHKGTLAIGILSNSMASHYNI